jgi:hypothetical protein
MDRASVSAAIWGSVIRGIRMINRFAPGVHDLIFLTLIRTRQRTRSTSRCGCWRRPRRASSCSSRQRRPPAEPALSAGGAGGLPGEPRRRALLRRPPVAAPVRCDPAAGARAGDPLLRPPDALRVRTVIPGTAWDTRLSGRFPMERCSGRAAGAGDPGVFVWRRVTYATRGPRTRLRSATGATREPRTRLRSATGAARGPRTRLRSATGATREPRTRLRSATGAAREPRTRLRSATGAAREPRTRLRSATCATREPRTRHDQP